MGGSKNKKIRNSVESTAGGAPSNQTIGDTTAQGRIEVELGKQNMKVSAEAWKAFQVYQQYEDWSSETEKTDYTYSRLSSYHNKEVAPGIPVRPNLCRSPIKPSSPNSMYDYTTEQKQNRRNSPRVAANHSSNSFSTSSSFSYVRHRSTTSDIADTPSSSRSIEVEEISYFHRVTEFFKAIWVSLTSKTSAISSGLGASVRSSASSFAAIFVAIWAYTAGSLQYLSSSVAQRWSAMFRKEVPISQAESRAGWMTDGSLLIWLKRSTTTVRTVVTSYYRAATMSVTPTTRRYLWCLLVPLLLLAGWQFLSADTKENLTSQLPSEQTLRNLWAGAVEWAYQPLNSVFSSLKSFWNSLPGLANSSTYLAFDGASYIWGYFLDGLGFIYNRLILCALQIQDGIKSLYEIAIDYFFGAMSLFSAFLASNETRTDYVQMPMPSGYEEREETLIVPTHTTGSKTTEEENTEALSPDLSYIAGIQDRIRILEDTLLAEKARRSNEEERIGAALKSYRNRLQEHRLQSEVALKRCCRWPCPNSYRPASVAMTSLDFSGLIAEMEEKLRAMESQTTAEIATLRQDIVASKGARREIVSGQFDAAMVRSIVDEAIKLYDADKTGRADYALQSAGGRIVSIRCTKAYTNSPPSLSWLSSLWTTSGGPEEAIKPGTAPGECWAFQGPVGQLALELSYPVRITGFTMEHISKHLSPSGTIDSAPQHFSVWGLKHADDLTEQYLFGDYIYQDNGETVQYFPVQHPVERTFKFVELKIVSNHGHPDYTCLYRIRVHGNVT